MSHSRFISLNESQKITIVKHSHKKEIEVLLEDNIYFKNKTYFVSICESEMKAISILFENNEYSDIDVFFNFLCDVFENPTKDRFYQLHINYEPDIMSFYIGIRNKYPYSNFGYVREKYKFKLTEKVF